MKKSKNVGATIGRPHFEENAEYNVGAGLVSARKEKGITLIALIITIIVMLILVAVSIQIALNTGLFESAGKATKDWKAAQENEANLGSQIEIGGTKYNSIDDYLAGVVEPENIDDWEYTVEEDGTITLTCYKGSATELVIPNYINGIPVKRIGTNEKTLSGMTGESLWDASICTRTLYSLNNQTIKKITISTGIEEILADAFLRY